MFHGEQRFLRGELRTSQKGGTALPATPETLWARSWRDPRGWPPILLPPRQVGLSPWLWQSLEEIRDLAWIFS